MHLFKFDTSRSLSVERRSPLLWPFFTNPNPQEFNNREENKLVGKHNAWKLPKNILFFQEKRLLEFLAVFFGWFWKYHILSLFNLVLKYFPTFFKKLNEFWSNIHARKLTGLMVPKNGNGSDTHTTISHYKTPFTTVKVAYANAFYSFACNSRMCSKSTQVIRWQCIPTTSSSRLPSSFFTNGS